MCSAITLHVESSVYENGEVLMNSFVLPFFPELARGLSRAGEREQGSGQAPSRPHRSF